MGELGQILPKPAWPLFETTLLAAQVEFAMTLGCRRIFINTHHLHEKLKNSLPSKYRSHITFLFEKEILGSGGGAHNLIKKNLLKTTQLLTLNSDAFFFIPQIEEFEKIFDQLPGNRALLMGANVTGQGLYKEMNVNNGYLVGFNDFSKKNNFMTYAGMSLINLEGFAPLEGKSNFFESVADFKNESIRVVSIPSSEFWDFGTKEYYKKNIYKMIRTLNRKEKTYFTDFLIDRELIDLKKVGETSYNSSQSGRVDFTSSCASLKEDNDENIIMIETTENSHVYCI